MHVVLIETLQLGVHLESRLKILDHFFIELECLAEDINRDWWLGSKHCIGNGGRTRVLTTQSSNGYSWGFSNIELEVD